MAKKKFVTEASKKKLLKALEILDGFSANASEKDTTDSPVQDILNITDTYRINNTGDTLRFDLIYKTRGVGALTNGRLHNAITSTDKIIVKDERDSLVNHSIEIDKVADRTFLEMRSLVTATNFTTPLPAKLNVEFSISGGVQKKFFTVPPASFKQVGDQIILEISIFFF
jgi:hypothetical protein